MTNQRHAFRNWVGSAFLLTAFVILCVRFFDIPVALYVKKRLYRNAHWSRYTSNLPDLLLVLVLVTTCVGCLLYLSRTKKGIYDQATSFEKLITWTAPVSYLAKSLLKFLFGRVNTRCWLQQPQLYGFHWFQRRPGCDGFPSGHMLVIVALLAAVWRFYPRCRPFCLLFAVLLAVALVVTNYHFVSDVAAGAFTGVLVEAVVFRLLREPSRLASRSIR